jgi:hypothetical protein
MVIAIEGPDWLEVPDEYASSNSENGNIPLWLARHRQSSAVIVKFIVASFIEPQEWFLFGRVGLYLLAFA